MEKYITSGSKAIFKERVEQLSKHNRSIEHDVLFNNNYQLAFAAKSLLEMIPYSIGIAAMPPEMEGVPGGFGWCMPSKSVPEGWSPKVMYKICSKKYKERLIIAGALIAAEIDRLNYIENNK